MKHSGRAMQAGLKLILFALIALLVIAAIGILATILGPLITFVSGFLTLLWFGFAVFTLFFFRDPTADVPSNPQAIVSPAYGTVDVIDEIDDPLTPGQRCKRISIFLSVFNVHVQYAPVSGTILSVKHTSGKFFNAMSADESVHNENVLIGFKSMEATGETIGLRLIAGLIARRIVPYVSGGEQVAKGERISLIQFGSRCDLLLPITATVQVAMGAKVRGGETIMALRS